MASPLRRIQPFTMTLLFWSCVAIDVGVVLVFFTLGLAAAGSARTSAAQVVLYLLVLPAIPLVGSVWVFVRSRSVAWRTVAFVLVALPIMTTVAATAWADATRRAYSDASGELTFFRPGTERDLVNAIRANDTLAVARALRTANVNAVGLDRMTPLVVAMRQLRKATTDVAVVRLLLAAGADPNTGTAFEYPLEMALQVTSRVGMAPVSVLLEAGANPSLKNGSGTPIFFASVGAGAPLDALRLLLAHGADLRATTRAGETVLIYAATAPNWRAAHLLLTAGADWTLGRSGRGLTFRELVDEAVRRGDERHGSASAQTQADGLADVIADLRAR